MKKQIHDMTEKEIFRQQLELLAEMSRNAMDKELASLTTAMTEVYKLMNRPAKVTTFLTCFSVMCLYFVTSLLVHVKKSFRGKP